MKILIIPVRPTGCNDKNFNYHPPLGLMYISSVLKRSGRNVDVLNLNHRSGKVEDIIHTALDVGEKYDFICTGGLSTHYQQVREVVEAVRGHKEGARIILGGGLITSEPELMLNALKPDFIVIGEGEKTIVELLSCLENGGNIAHVLGIGYRDKSGKIVINQPQPAIKDLESLPLPDFEGFELETYMDNLKPSSNVALDLYDFPRAYPLICSRSCPFKCTFCFHPVGKLYRQRSMDSIINELDTAINRYKANVIIIYDELFSLNKERVYEFCERLKKIQEGVSWKIRWMCQMRVDKLDKEFLKTMKDAGCYMVSYGFESYSPVVLKSMKKQITPSQIDKAIKLTLEQKISIVGNFIFGDKAETVQTANETLDYWKANHHYGIMFAFINPYPGTELYNHCIEKGIIKDKLDFIENHITDAFNMTDTMTDEEYEKLLCDTVDAWRKYRLYAVPISVKKNENGTAYFKIKCPHCNKIVEYDNFAEINFMSDFNLTFCRKCRGRFFLASRLYIYKTKAHVMLTTLLGFKLRRKVRNIKNTFKRILP